MEARDPDNILFYTYEGISFFEAGGSVSYA